MCEWVREREWVNMDVWVCTVTLRVRAFACRPHSGSIHQSVGSASLPVNQWIVEWVNWSVYPPASHPSARWMGDRPPFMGPPRLYTRQDTHSTGPASPAPSPSTNVTGSPWQKESSICETTALFIKIYPQLKIRGNVTAKWGWRNSPERQRKVYIVSIIIWETLSVSRQNVVPFLNEFTKWRAEKYILDELRKKLSKRREITSEKMNWSTAAIMTI